MANPEHVAIVRAGKEAIEEWRKADSGGRLDLSGADLSGVDLSGFMLTGDNTNLVGMNGPILEDARLNVANLTGTILQGVNLSHASLKGANLCYANLTGSVLRNADLSQADLFETSLRFADVTDARFTGAICSHTGWDGIDLSVAKDLDSVMHHGRSEVGFHTLTLSRGQIPESFLRGCGLSEEFIQYIPSLFAESAFQFYSCFISYSHKDKQFARQLHDRLQGKGIRCWLDEHQLNPGDDIYERVDRGIRVWDKVLLCCSEHSLNSWWVDREINTAIEKEQEFHRERGERALKIIPLNLDGSLFEWQGSQAAEIRRRLAADCTDWKSDADRFEAEFEKVVRALSIDGGGMAEPVGRL